jgi:hypothetical protein
MRKSQNSLVRRELLCPLRTLQQLSKSLQTNCDGFSPRTLTIEEELEKEKVRD